MVQPHAALPARRYIYNDCWMHHGTPSSYAGGLRVEDVFKGAEELRKEIEELKALVRGIKEIPEE